jgi:hypothetical protein
MHTCLPCLFIHYFLLIYFKSFFYVTLQGLIQDEGQTFVDFFLFFMDINEIILLM